MPTRSCMGREPGSILTIAGALVLAAHALGCSDGNGRRGPPLASTTPTSTTPTTSATPAPTTSTTNAAPVISLSTTPRSAPLNAAIALRADVTDDQPSPSVGWRQVAGPGQVHFGTSEGGATVVAADAPGVYTVACVASDGASTVRTEVELTWTAAKSTPPHPGSGFLDTPANDELAAQAYYRAIDPAGEKTTLAAWQAATGLDAAQDARAVYFNAGDLRFGRRMTMRRTATGIAYAVQNYGTVEDAVDDVNLIATVAMEVSPGAAGGAPFAKFYIFGGDGRRLPGVDLDGGGVKYLPALCISCHGGTSNPLQGGVYPNGGDVGASLLPFDLDQFEFSPRPGARKEDQEAALKQLNRGARDFARTPAMRELIEGWYGGPALPRATQLTTFVPPGWAGQEALYQQVVAQSCRGCHVTRAAPLDFARAADLRSQAGLVVQDVFATRTMPHSRVTFDRFWRGAQPALLQAALLRDEPAPTALPLAGVAVEHAIDGEIATLFEVRERFYELRALLSEDPARLLRETGSRDAALRALLPQLSPEARPRAEARLARLREAQGEVGVLLANQASLTALAAERDNVRLRHASNVELGARALVAGRLGTVEADFQRRALGDLLSTLPPGLASVARLRQTVRELVQPLGAPGSTTPP